MAEETKPAEGNGSPSPEEHAAAIAAAAELLKADGHQVLDSAAFHGIKAKAAAAAEAKEAELAKKLASLQAEHNKLAEWKADKDNEGKTQTELDSAKQRAWEASDREKDTSFKSLQKDHADLQKQLASERVSNQLSALLTNANDPEMALDWARKKIGDRLSTNDARELVWTADTGVPHEGPAAAALVAEWWGQERQKSLQSGNVPGPATSGSETAPPPPATKAFQRDPSRSAMENYQAAEDWDRTHGTLKSP